MRRSCGASSRVVSSTRFIKNRTPGAIYYCREKQSGQERQRQFAHMPRVNDAVAKALFGAFFTGGIASGQGEFTEKYFEESFDGFAVAVVDRFLFRHRILLGMRSSACKLAPRRWAAKRNSAREDFYAGEYPTNTKTSRAIRCGRVGNNLEEGNLVPSSKNSFGEISRRRMIPVKRSRRRYPELPQGIQPAPKMRSTRSRCKFS